MNKKDEYMNNEFALTSLKCMSNMLGIDVICSYYTSSLFGKSHQPVFCAKIANHTLRIIIDELMPISQATYNYLAFHSIGYGILFKWNYSKSSVMLECFLASRSFKLIDGNLRLTKICIGNPFYGKFELMYCTNEEELKVKIDLLGINDIHDKNIDDVKKMLAV